MCQKRRSVPVVGRAWRASVGTSGPNNETGSTKLSTATSSLTPSTVTTTTTTNVRTTTKTVTKTPSRTTRTRSHENPRKNTTDVDPSKNGMIATALAAAVHVDLDQHGRPSGDITSVANKINFEGWDMDAHQRADALIKLGAISRRRSAVCAGDYVSTDLCGRGDPAIFARIRKTGGFTSDSMENPQTEQPKPIDAASAADAADAADAAEDSSINPHHLVKSDLDAIANAQLHRQPTELPSANIEEGDVHDTDLDVNRKLALPHVKSERRASKSRTARERLRRTKSHQVRHSKQPLYKTFTKWFSSRRRKTT